jgi:hypothetical protein
VKPALSDDLSLARSDCLPPDHRSEVNAPGLSRQSSTGPSSRPFGFRLRYRFRHHRIRKPVAELTSPIVLYLPRSVATLLAMTPSGSRRPKCFRTRGLPSQILSISSRSLTYAVSSHHQIIVSGSSDGGQRPLRRRAGIQAPAHCHRCAVAPRQLTFLVRLPDTQRHRSDEPAGLPSCVTPSLAYYRVCR